MVECRLTRETTLSNELVRFGAPGCSISQWAAGLGHARDLGLFLLPVNGVSAFEHKVDTYSLLFVRVRIRVCS